MRFVPSFVSTVASRPTPSAEAATSSAIETVVLVHGTFANVQHDGATDWWRPGSSYARSLDEQLLASGCAARCWAHLKGTPFAWTGANTERARRDAGRALAEEIESLEGNPRIAKYHLVAHSHAPCPDTKRINFSMPLINGTAH
jgi:hypothetical protein